MKLCCIFTIESATEKILKIGQYFGEVMDNIMVDCFLTHNVKYSFLGDRL